MTVSGPVGGGVEGRGSVFERGAEVGISWLFVLMDRSFSALPAKGLTVEA